MLHMCTLLLDVLGVQPNGVQQCILVCMTHQAIVMLVPRLMLATVLACGVRTASDGSQTVKHSLLLRC